MGPWGGQWGPETSCNFVQLRAGGPGRAFSPQKTLKSPQKGLVNFVQTSCNFVQLRANLDLAGLAMLQGPCWIFSASGPQKCMSTPLMEGI